MNMKRLRLDKDIQPLSASRANEALEVLRDVHLAEQQLAEDGGVPHKEAKARVLARLGK